MIYLSIVSLLTVLSSVSAFAPIASTNNYFQIRHLRPNEDVGWRMASSPTDGDKKSSMPDVSEVLGGISNLDLGQVMQNTQEGELGKRGEIYFALQAILIFFILIGGVPIIGDSLDVILGPSLLLGGGVIALLSLADLGSDSLSPFPTPPKDGSLKTEGIYSQMRHPMYAGLLGIVLGFSILTGSADRLLLTGLLYLLLEVKSEKEDDFLLEQYGNDFAKYKEKVPGKFVPAALLDNLPFDKK